MPNWKKVIVSGSDASLNSLEIVTSLTASGLIYPTIDNGEKSFIQTDGNGNLSLQYVETLLEPLRNGESFPLVKGTPVYISGSLGANPIVYAADSANPSKMPVIYIINETVASNEVGTGILLGNITGVNTTGYPSGTEIYIAPGGGWTSTRPTGSAIIQSLGIVTREGTGGRGIVLNPGPVNLPNIPSGYAWVGDSNSYPIAIPTSSIQNVVSASYSLFALSASNAPGFTTNHTQLTASTTWSFNHNLNTRNPLLQAYDLNYNQIIPNEIVGIDAFTSEIRFDYTQAGYAVASNGGGLYITGSTPRLVQTVAATTWSFQHNLGTKYPGFEVFNSNDDVIIPSGIHAVDINNAEIYFAVPTTGIAIANFSGINGLTDNAVSASYAATASYSDQFNIGQTQTQYSTVTSSINGPNIVSNQATGSYTSAFYKYTIASGSNSRSGEIMSVWNGSTVEFTDNSTVDIGTTTAVTSSVSLSGANVRLNMQTNTSGWRIKSIATFI